MICNCEEWVTNRTCVHTNAGDRQAQYEKLEELATALVEDPGCAMNLEGYDVYESLKKWLENNGLENNDDWFDQMSKESEDDDELFDSAWEEGVL